MNRFFTVNGLKSITVVSLLVYMLLTHYFACVLLGDQQKNTQALILTCFEIFAFTGIFPTFILGYAVARHHSTNSSRFSMFRLTAPTLVLIWYYGESYGYRPAILTTCFGTATFAVLMLYLRHTRTAANRN
jgi:glucose-6-phosphate-specific signal transduction histidine kinase